MNGGALVAETLQKHGVRFVFTLCGGHISPILVESAARGIRVADVRHEATAVFAADAVARLSGIPGVAAVTAGPGLSNTITAVKNAQLAQSPLILLGGATATVLRGRGALQDIDQRTLLAPHVKRVFALKRVRDIPHALAQAFRAAQSGVPGPVFVELPVDLLYEESVVRAWYLSQSGGKTLGARLEQAYLKRHLDGMFRGADKAVGAAARIVRRRTPGSRAVQKILAALRKAKRPVIVAGSQLVSGAPDTVALSRAFECIGAPVYLAGMARGLLGKDSPLQMRHERRTALREADLVVLLGLACDFRLDYGRSIARSARLISVNLSAADLKLNRRPSFGVRAHPAETLLALAAAQVEPENANGTERSGWFETLRARDAQREIKIVAEGRTSAERVNPIRLCQAIDAILPDESVLVADGGDFVGTAAYIVRPRSGLSWLDPGLFGTLGAGAGFALGAKLARPEAEVWILYGDGSLGYSLAEFDTFVRLKVPVIGVVGNDAGWTQIAREQMELLKSDVAVRLDRSDYHRAVEGLGADGFVIQTNEDVADILERARSSARAGRPVLVNAHLAGSEFRKGSISI